jgi:NADPH:quinone reductase-like Zn-dependent oxidoreductase
MIPKTMRAAVIDQPGGPEVVQVRTVPVASLDAGEILMAVHATGLASWDVEMREGWWPGKRPRGPIILGTDGSGTVVAVGSRVRRFAVGDQVYAYSFGNAKGGFHAEFVALAAENVAALPAGFDMLSAGAVPAAGLTALDGVARTLKIKRGDTLVVHAASGSIGSLAMQFAKNRGARVLAVASGRDGVALVQRLGADAAVDGKRGHLAEAIRDFASDGVDAVLAFAGGEALNEILGQVRPGGRLAYPNGVEPRPRRRRGVDIVTYDAEGGARGFARLGRALEAARPEVPIEATYPLAKAAQAHRRLAKGHTLGRVMLQVR